MPAPATLPDLIPEGESRTLDCRQATYFSVSPAAGATAAVRSAMSAEDEEGRAESEVAYTEPTRVSPPGWSFVLVSAVDGDVAVDAG